MLILFIRTDKPEAEIGLNNGTKQIAYVKWQAHRELAETIHLKIKDLLDANKLALTDLRGVAAYKGPDSFTGLRIGLSVANALADSLKIPIVAETGANWIQVSTESLEAGNNDGLAMPEYGAPPHITQPKK